MPDQVDWRAMEREATPGRAVGRLLRDQREARGQSLADVAKSLRIRRTHLEAIEEGRFDKLPGAAYIPAFLRAYASYVELDPEKVMTAYHLSGPVPIKRPVALPADFPIVERRAPIGLAVLTVLLMVGAGYGIWHYLPREQAVVAEKVPPVPDRLLASRPATMETPSPTAPPTAPPAETQTGQARRPADVWPAQRQDVGTASPTPAPVAPTPLAPPPVVVAVPAPPVVMAVPAIGQAQAAQPPLPVEPPRLSIPGQGMGGQTAGGQTPPTEEANARQPVPDVPAAVQPSLPVKVNTPISVRSNSWIELRAPNGDVLTQTYVRAGESYVVPAGIAYRITEAR